MWWRSEIDALYQILFYLEVSFVLLFVIEGEVCKIKENCDLMMNELMHFNSLLSPLELLGGMKSSWITLVSASLVVFFSDGSHELWSIYSYQEEIYDLNLVFGHVLPVQTSYSVSSRGHINRPQWIKTLPSSSKTGQSAGWWLLGLLWIPPSNLCCSISLH